jgi:hypothetical protein
MHIREKQMKVKPAKNKSWQMTTSQDNDWKTTKVKINAQVEVGAVDGWLCFWAAGREIRIGPLTPEQAEKLAEDLGYEAMS